MVKDRKEGQYFVDLLCGGCNLVDKVDGNRIANDLNKYIIALAKEMQKESFDCTEHIGEIKYKEIQNNKEKFEDWKVGYVGFQLSFGAKFFGGYRRDKVGIRDYENEAQQNLKTQQSLIKGIEFFNKSYDEIEIPKESIIYCDIPYKNTTKYSNKNSFDYEKFYDWCIEIQKQGHKLFISEYEMPEDRFECIWQKEIISSLTKDTGSKKGIEKLFVVKTK